MYDLVIYVGWFSINVLSHCIIVICYFFLIWCPYSELLLYYEYYVNAHMSPLVF